MSCPGAGHCACCSGGAVLPLVPLAAIYGLAWIAEHIVQVIATSATCAALSVAAVVALAGWTERREARYAASRSLLYARSEAVPAVTATATLQVSQGTVPAIENHIHYHFDPADREAARIIRQAFAGAVPVREEIPS